MVLSPTGRSGSVGTTIISLLSLSSLKEMSPSKSERSSPVSIWKEEDVINGARVPAMVVILRTRGCWWSREEGCLMCGYNLVSSSSITIEDLSAQLEEAAKRYDEEPFVKVYTSGSFLDHLEVPPEFRKKFYDTFSSARRILFESRPEFVTSENLLSIDAARSEAALGLESANDSILRTSVRKGFSFSDYLQAKDVLSGHNIPIRTYLLLKPPFLSEREGVEDVLESISKVSDHSESISINPINVQKGTMVERLWKKGDYRPPWLWSLVEVLRRSKEISSCRVFSSPSGGGSLRGVHNCDACDRKILERVQRFSFSQDAEEFLGLDCGCRREWAALMDVQDTISTSVNIERYLGNDMRFD